LQQLLLQQQQPLKQQNVFAAARWMQTSSAAAGEVVVPAMGDSITEGSVAALLKQPGGLLLMLTAHSLVSALHVPIADWHVLAANTAHAVVRCVNTVCWFLLTWITN
jgi:hypothetical protein